jgi:hypothetical protein
MDQKRTEPEQVEDIELRPDGWERFEKAVDAALRTPPQHRTKPQEKPSISKVKRKP